MSLNPCLTFDGALKLRPSPLVLAIRELESSDSSPVEQPDEPFYDFPIIPLGKSQIFLSTYLSLIVLANSCRVAGKTALLRKPCNKTYLFECFRLQYNRKEKSFRVGAH